MPLDIRNNIMILLGNTSNQSDYSLNNSKFKISKWQKLMQYEQVIPCETKCSIYVPF